MGDIRDFIRNSTKREMSEKRQSLLKDLDGDMFYSLSVWRHDMRRLLWKKPIGDKESFKLVLFLMRNGCPPTLVIDWIVSSTY